MFVLSCFYGDWVGTHEDSWKVVHVWAKPGVDPGEAAGFGRDQSPLISLSFYTLDW